MRIGRHTWAAAGIALAIAVPSRALAADGAAQEKAAMQQIQIVKEDFRGWPNTYRLSNGLIEARVVTDIGPRIMDVHVAGGANLLYVRDAEAGKSGEDTWVQRGGYRLWIAPERAETTYALDNTRCEVEVIKGSTLRVTGPPQPAAGIRKQVAVSLTPGVPRLRIAARIENVSDHALTYAAWSLPVLRPKGRAFVPLDVGPVTSFDAIRRLILWSYTEMSDPRYRFGDRLLEIDHSKVQPAPAAPGRRDDESKIGTDSAQGWAAYLLDGTLLLKRFDHDPSGQYADGGATIEVYSSHEFLELEHLGPLTTIKQGEQIILREDWWLFPGANVPAGATEALPILQGYVAKTVPPGS